jgi:predicted RNA-binding protein associated with RNAse of E/G family
MREIKRTLDGKIVEYPAEPLVIEPGVRTVLLCRINEAEVVAGGRMTLEPGALSVGYFWCDRPYNVYHWLNGGRTLLHYVNIGRFVSLSADALTWDDYAVDVLAYPGGVVDVIDQDEIPDTVDDATRAFIRDATAAVLGEIDAIVAAVDAETKSLCLTGRLT